MWVKNQEKADNFNIYASENESKPLTEPAAAHDSLSEIPFSSLDQEVSSPLR